MKTNHLVSHGVPVYSLKWIVNCRIRSFKVSSVACGKSFFSERKVLPSNNPGRHCSFLQSNCFPKIYATRHSRRRIASIIDGLPPVNRWKVCGTLAGNTQVPLANLLLHCECCFCPVSAFGKQEARLLTACCWETAPTHCLPIWWRRSWSQRRRRNMRE